MIQFNLLPDIKLDYIKARRAKRSVIVVSTLATSGALAIFIVLFLTVNVFQKNHISDLTGDINTEKTKLQEVQDLDKILTIQNQLNSITALHEKKPVTTRLFTFLPQLVPDQATVSELKLDFEQSSIEFTGTADNLVTVNKFVDTLKFTQYDMNEQEVNAFSEVVLADFNKVGGDGAVSEANYVIRLLFDPLIFDSANSVKLKVPNIISTRSETEKPSETIFRQQSNPTLEGSAQ